MTNPLTSLGQRSTLHHDRVRPTFSSPRGTYLAKVKTNERICTDHYRLTLSIPRFPKSVPGQFIQIDCSDPHLSSTTDHEVLPPRSFDWPPPHPTYAAPPSDPDFNTAIAYLRRPFSIARHQVWPDGYTELTILHRVVGKGTLALAQLRPEHEVSIIGPLGCGFSIPNDLDLACMVGGGVGIPPMFFLARALSERGFKNAIAFMGAQRHDLLPITFSSAPAPAEGEAVGTAPESSKVGDPVMNVEEFKEYGYPTVCTTDDGSLGMKGFVTEALANFLEEQQVQKGKLTNTIVYCCGPTPMMKATARVAAQFGVQCQVSLEQPMACGMGTCQSCVVRFKPHDQSSAENAPQDWKYKLTCTDGPVFDARDLCW